MNNTKCIAWVALFSLLLLCTIASAGTMTTKAQKFEKPAVKMTLQGLADYPQLYVPSTNTAKAYNGPKAGGEDIPSATVIPGLPYSDAGTTTGAADDYDPILSGFCPSQTNAPDVVYSYTPAAGELITVTSCNSAYWTRLFIYENDSLTLVACNQYSDSCLDPFHAAIYNVAVVPPNTYYIVVDGGPASGDRFGNYEIEVSALPPVDTLRIHPALADAGNGNLMLTYRMDDYDSVILWSSSIDDGQSFSGGVFWDVTPGVGDYQTMESYGNGTSFHGTFVPQEDASSAVRWVEVQDVADNGTWTLWTWDFADPGGFDLSDIKANDIACNDSLETWNFGFMSLVATLDYYGTPYSEIDFIFYPTSAEGQASISAYGVEGCNTTTNAIDSASIKAYAAWDYYDTDDLRWNFAIRQEKFDDFDDTLFSGMWLFGVDGGNVQYPDMAAYDGHVLIASEYWEDATPENKDIVVSYVPNGDFGLDEISTVTVVETEDAERFPRIQHVVDSSFVLIFVRNDSLFMVLTEDNGVTWGTPEYVSLDGDLVVEEYRTAHLAESDGFDVKIVYSYYEDTGSKTYEGPVYVRLREQLIYEFIDTDTDGIQDSEDNCPNTPNPLQEDFDEDGYGDACDNCPQFWNEDQADGDGDNVGNVCDNCPEVANNDQSDVDSDNVGDVCDNCPNDYNPGQEDANSNGVGDVCDYMCGDVNDDDAINLLDILFLIDFIYGTPQGPAPDPIESGDVNNADGAVNLLDILYLIDFIYGTPAGPAPDCIP